MPWDDARDLEKALKLALDSFNWTEADAVCEEIVRRVSVDESLLPEPSAKILLESLRGKSRFRSMTLLAEALQKSGLRTPLVRRLYAQGLIDQDLFFNAEPVLESIINDPQVAMSHKVEAHGLMGRLFKQLYINNNDTNSPRNRANLERSLKEYSGVYEADKNSYWHGINVLALTKRALRDGVPIANLPNPETLAAEIVATLDRRISDGLPITAWENATRMESYIALGRDKEALDMALRYLDAPDADAFALQSTLRQLMQVWRLSDAEPPGSLILPTLKASHLRLMGGKLEFDPKNIAREAAVTDKAAAQFESSDFEAVFGPTRMQTFLWYRKGLEQCNSVARVEEHNGRGRGTGWLVNAGDFFPGWTGVLLLTNNHVVSDPKNPYSLLPQDARVNFQALGEIYNVEREVVWESSLNELDATFLRLKPNANGEPKATALTLHEGVMTMIEPPPRMYIIGHPAGRDLELSLQDNFLIACNDSLLHYRTPTERGSSGSPVFEPDAWRVVALHHKGSQAMKRIDGKEGTYEANEGVTIQAILQRTRAAGLPPPPSHHATQATNVK